MSVFWGEMKQGRSPLFIFHFGELLDEVPGILRRHLSIIFPFKAGEIGSWHRFMIIRDSPYRLVPEAGAWYERKSLKRIGSSETSCLARSPTLARRIKVRVGWSNQWLFFMPVLGLKVNFVLWASYFCGFFDFSGGFKDGVMVWFGWFGCMDLNECLGLAVIIPNYINNDCSYCHYE